MSRLRLTGRWLLTVIAVIAIVLACLTTAIRVTAWQIDRATPWLASVMESELSAQVSLGALSLDMRRLDPRVALDDVEITSNQGQPLLSVDHAGARLRGVESWQRRGVVIDRGNLQGLTLHLYQTPSGGWGWPEGAGAGWFEGDDSSQQGVDVDGVLRTLLHQQGELENATLVLHGPPTVARETSSRSAPSRPTLARLTVSRLVLASSDRRASLQATLESQTGEASTLQLTIDATQGESLRARGAMELDLAGLSPLISTLTSSFAKSIAQIEGRAAVAASWSAGELSDARLSLDVPRLRLADTQSRLSNEFVDMGLTAQMRRNAQGGWQAFVDDLRLSRPGAPEVNWPQHLEARSVDDGWRLRTTPFAIDGLLDYLRFLPLEFDAIQPLLEINPRGRVTGLEVGQDDGEWYAVSSLSDVASDAWDGIPGGGPVDAWAAVHGRSGRVTFASNGATRFVIPMVYAEPLELSRASGAIGWELTHDGFLLNGENLRAGWRGATAGGRFGLATYEDEDKPGALYLDIDFANADARNTRALAWLPTRVIDDPQLRQWFDGDIGGIVRQGHLGLSLTLSEEEAPEGHMFVNPEDSLTLALDVADGRLQYDPEWPALERVYGHVSLENMNMQAQIEHATSHGLTTRNAVITLADDDLVIDGDVDGTSGGLLDFLANAPLGDLSRTFGLWQTEGELGASTHIELPLGAETDLETAMRVDVDGWAEIDSLIFPELNLSLEGINGDLRYRREQGEDYTTGTLGARTFGGPMLANFNIGGIGQRRAGIDIQGRALSRGLLGWAGLSQVGGLLDGFIPYRGHLEFDDQDQVRLAVQSDLESVAIHLPPPFGKPIGEPEALVIDADISTGTGRVEMDDWGRARWRTLGEQVQGQVWLESWPGGDAAWPSDPGWYVLWHPERLDTRLWAQALSELEAGDSEIAEHTVSTSITDDDTTTSTPVNDGGGLKRVALSTSCVLVDDRCLGGLQADASPLGDGWRLSLQGEIADGEASWRPQAPVPIDIDLTRLNLDALMPAEEDDASDVASPPRLMEEIVIAPRPAALPEGLSKVPRGRLRIDEIQRQAKRFGPFAADWRADDTRLSVSALSLTLDEITLSGTLDWQAAGDASLSRTQLSVEGDDIASAFRALALPVPITSDSTDIQAQLSWPGAPWQFSLPRVSGRTQASLGAGRLRQVHSSSAKLVGLFNLDNILRRLTLDFSDVTDGGTAFNSLNGSATLYNGTLRTEEPMVVDGTSTRFTLAGSVDLNRRELDQRLGITVPVSQNLPLIAVIAGVPQVGLGLFVADQLFGQWLDRATQIYYRIEGPWSSPNINLESAQ